ncbi:MAG: prephenate dehydratase domain-containing protein, partial [Acidimicrobiales bacterium]|nr:prephenate dehydratase domain-containing protein [Acidimicrobiales bacterium]
MTDIAHTDRKVLAYLGPNGTFTEQALLTQDDLAGLDLRLASSIPEVLSMVGEGSVDLGFAAIENSIEGSVNI